MAISRHNTPQNEDIFVVDGKPVSFYLWGTSNDEGPGWSLSVLQREALAQKIEQHGGLVCKSLQRADTIIVQERGVEEVADRYVLSTRRYVEPPAFVSACIRNRRYAHKPVKQHVQPLSGRTPGHVRTEFTQADDMHLCKFLSTAIPDPEAGGRQGNKLYKMLEASAEYDSDMRWARRHSWQSWRERYKKNRQRFDPIIQSLVKENPPPPDGKGMFPFDRRVNGQQNAAFMRLQLRQEEEEEIEDEQGEFEPTRDSGEEEEDVEDDADAGYPDYEPVEQEIPRRNARRETDPGPRRRSASPVGPGGRARTHTGPSRRSATPTGEFEPDEDYDFEYQPEEPIAGPSGTQRSPSVSPVAPSPPPQYKRKPQPRASAAAMQSQTNRIPMSSQATLVGPVPTQLRNAPAVQKPHQQQAQAGPGPRTLAQGGLRAAVRANAIVAEDDEEDEGADDEDEEVSEEELELHTVGQTNEEEQDVEELLDESYEQSARLSPEVEDEESAMSVEVQLDSDDERTRQKLLNSRSRAAIQAGPSRTQSRKRAAHEEDDEDEDDIIQFAQTLDFDKPAHRQPSVTPPQSSTGRRLLAPATPESSRVAVVRARTDGYASSESAVPLPYTRASTEKKKRRIEETYEPPEGTRAAEASVKKTAPKPKAPSPPTRRLRNRAVLLSPRQ